MTRLLVRSGGNPRQGPQRKHYVPASGPRRTSYFISPVRPVAGRISSRCFALDRARSTPSRGDRAPSHAVAGLFARLTAHAPPLQVRRLWCFGFPLTNAWARGSPPTCRASFGTLSNLRCRETRLSDAPRTFLETQTRTVKNPSAARKEKACLIGTGRGNRSRRRSKAPGRSIRTISWTDRWTGRR